jgi:hypothetical protein
MRKALFFRVQCGALTASILAGVAGVFIAWHICMATPGVTSFDPLWCLLPIALAELEVRLYSIYEVKKDCIRQQGNRFVMAGGTVINVPVWAPIQGVFCGLLAALDYRGAETQLLYCSLFFVIRP